MSKWREVSDNVRPPVLAHQRFVANRGKFAGLDLAGRFQRIEEINLWGAETSVSGLGSEYPATQSVREALPALLTHLNVNTLLDAPCGDARWILSTALEVIYIGVDIVPSLIESNRAVAKTIPGRRNFSIANITIDPLPAADLILCRDCFVHLTFAHIFKAIANFRASGAQWLLTTTFPLWKSNGDCEDGDWRALNMERSPFHWPRPAMLINERCDEGNGGWNDKSLGLWKLADLPECSLL
ncbi:MAG TPA: class I SAM-dependent methyltransferase [Sphingobium sp.]